MVLEISKKDSDETNVVLILTSADHSAVQQLKTISKGTTQFKDWFKMRSCIVCTFIGSHVTEYLRRFWEQYLKIALF